AHQHIYFAAYSKLRQVDAGLDREAGVGKNLPLIVNLQIVHVGPIRMDVGADGMSGAVNKIIAVAGFLDMPASGAVHFPAGNASSRLDGGQYGLHPDIARVAHNLKYFAHAPRESAADKAHPCI